jgi:hypothetical protein
MKSNATGENRTIWRIELTATRTAQSVDKVTSMSVIRASRPSLHQAFGRPIDYQQNKEDEEFGWRKKRR